MNNLMDVVEQTDVPDMFAKLEQVYLQTLGIKILAVNDDETYPKMGYLLEDPQKFPFLKWLKDRQGLYKNATSSQGYYYY